MYYITSSQTYQIDKEYYQLIETTIDRTITCSLLNNLILCYCLSRYSIYLFT